VREMSKPKAGEKEKEILIEPMTRIEGHLGIHAKADVPKRVYADAHSFATMFRGFEMILKGREPADAIWITQRICGVCPVPHAVASAQTIDMTYNVTPPPMGAALRNLVHIAEQLYDSALGCIILEGPDYSQAIVKKFNPEWWKAAQKTRAGGANVHGYATIANIMTALNPLAGNLWLKGLEMVKLGRDMAALLGGKHPHIQTFLPGGVSNAVTVGGLEAYAAMLARQIAFSKEFIPIFNDLLDFFISMGYEESGARPANFISYGAYDDPEAYNAKYENMSEWGEKRKVTPGVIINGKVVTNDLVEINVGVREFVDHSFYKRYYAGWEQQMPRVKEDPLGNDIAKEHPWNKETVPEPGPMKSWESRYSWATSPRWHDWRNRVGGNIAVVEAGPIARMWSTAKSGKVPESTGSSLKFSLPKATVAGYKVAEETEFEWKIPAKPSTVERVRARAYYHAYSAYVALDQLVSAMQLVKQGKTEAWKPYRRPQDGLGVGLTEAMRGGVAHWCVMKDGKANSYQVITPSAWNSGPRDDDGRPGPYEEAIIGTPVTEASESNAWEGVDIVRVVRSFDPCLGCTVHIHVGDQTVVQEIPV